jgi:hypothetical protein
MKAKMEVTKGLPEHPEGFITMQSFSASKRDGIADLERQLVHWLKPAPIDDLKPGIEPDAGQE